VNLLIEVSKQLTRLVAILNGFGKALAGVPFVD
jgi:hypothetical protein